jgi:hypothetical protein
MDYPLPKELSYYNLKSTPQIKIKFVVVKKKKACANQSIFV